MRKREIVSFSIVKLNAFTSLKIFETRSKIALKPIEIGQKPWKHSKRKKAEKLKSNYAFNFLFNNSFPISLDRRKFHERSLSAFDKTGRGEKRSIVLPHFLQTYEIHFRIEIITRIKEKKLYIGIKFKFLSSSGPRFANILLSLFVVYI